MQIFILILIFSIVFCLLAFNRSIEITSFLKFNLFLFMLRTVVSLIFFLFLSDLINYFGSDSTGRRFVVISIFSYAFIVYLYSKVLLKNFLRFGEVFARFTLEAMPGQQMAIESGKRDGILSIDEAQKRRTESLNNSLKFTSVETALRILGSEPIIVSMLIIISILFGIFDYTTSNNLKEFENLLANLLMSGTIVLVSGVLTLIPISKFTFGESFDEVREWGFNLNNFYVEIVKYSAVLILLTTLGIWSYIALRSSFFEALMQVLLLIVVGIIASFFAVKFRSKDTGKFLILELGSNFNISDNFNFTNQSLLYECDKDLVITYHSNEAVSKKEEFLKQITQALTQMESLFIKVPRVILSHRPAQSAEEHVKFEWESEAFEITITNIKENKIVIVRRYFLEHLSSKLVSSINTSDVIKKLNEKYFKNSNMSFINGLDYSNYEFITGCIKSLHSKGIIADNLISLVEFSISQFDEQNEDSVISAYLNSNSALFHGADGICRILYLKSLSDASKLTDIVTNLRSRNISPIVLVASKDDEKVGSAQIGTLYKIEKDLLPAHIDFFPIPVI